MVSLRDASTEDAAAMAQIQSASLRANAAEHYTDEQLAHVPPAPDPEVIPDTEFLRASCRPTVAEVSGAIVGWGSVHLDEGVLAATFVDPDHAGRGIGRTIVTELETIARREDIDELVVPASLNAVGFYEALGFERPGEIDAGGPDSPPIPSIQLRKDLS